MECLEQRQQKQLVFFKEYLIYQRQVVVDYATWYKISDVYVGVTRIAELRGGIEAE